MQCDAARHSSSISSQSRVIIDPIRSFFVQITLNELLGLGVYQLVLDSENPTGAQYLAFVSGRNPDGKYWCPDVSRNMDAIRSSVMNAGGNLLEIEVGEMAHWKDPRHPLRMDYRFTLKAIPTLMLWRPSNDKDERGELARLDTILSDRTMTQEALAAEIDKFVQNTRNLF